jgi:predicted nucleic acid-binding protein
MLESEHMSSVILDTNLLLYAVDEDSKYFEAVQNLINNQSLHLFTTSKNLSEFLAVVTRSAHTGLSIEEALAVLEDFQTSSTILYPSEESYKIFKVLLQKYNPQGLKIHDYEIIIIALSHKINNIATFNRKDFADIQEIILFPF